MGDFNIVEEYIAKVKNLKAKIITLGGKVELDSKYASIA